MEFRETWRLLSLVGSFVGVALAIFGILELVRGCAGSGFFLLGLAALPISVASRQFAGLASVVLFGLSALAYTAYASC